MNVLEIRTAERRTQFRPGEVIEGNIEWVLERSVEALELRLIWFTSGKGDADVSIEDSQRFESPALSDSAPFRFVFPEAPYSFSGKLISLSWALELVVIPGADATQFALTMSPTGEEVLLPQSDEAGVAPIKKLPPWLQSKVQNKVTGRVQRDQTPQGQSALRQENPFDH
jgi:hypothetical protein